MYANSKLRPNLPPVRLYMDTYPLLCLAARYSDCVYGQPREAERLSHIRADWRTGTKAMVIKSVPMDNANTIVFAICGTATFMDWAVNVNAAPTSPSGFLDDLGNYCHAGLLFVACKMIHPVAVRLSELLQESPGRSSYSLLIAGHSAGGAVASLLYSHMLATYQQASSKLSSLARRFRRIHCITFGTPPISLLPLSNAGQKGSKKCLFFSIINEGDPVVRTRKEYVKSLLELLMSPLPGATSNGRYNLENGTRGPSRKSETSPSRPRQLPKPTEHCHHRAKPVHSTSTSRRNHEQRPVWKLPPSTLSNPGRVIVLRTGHPPHARNQRHGTIEEMLDEGVVAQLTTDEQLRDVIWGDPVYHSMKLYAGRIETLAIGAVTTGDCISL